MAYLFLGMDSKEADDLEDSVCAKDAKGKKVVDSALATEVAKAHKLRKFLGKNPFVYSKLKGEPDWGKNSVPGRFTGNDEKIFLNAIKTVKDS